MFKVVFSLLQGFFSTHTAIKWLIVCVGCLLGYIIVASLITPPGYISKKSLEHQLAVKEVEVETLVVTQKATEKALEKQEKANEVVTMITTQEQHNMFLEIKQLEEINRNRESQIKAIEKHYKVKHSPTFHHNGSKHKPAKNTAHHPQSKKKQISRVQIATLWSTYCLYNSNPSCHG